MLRRSFNVNHIISLKLYNTFVRERKRYLTRSQIHIEFCFTLLHGRCWLLLLDLLSVEWEQFFCTVQLIEIDIRVYLDDAVELSVVSAISCQLLVHFYVVLTVFQRQLRELFPNSKTVGEDTVHAVAFSRAFVQYEL